MLQTSHFTSFGTFGGATPLILLTRAVVTGLRKFILTTL